MVLYRDLLPATVETKRLHTTPNNPAAKGHDRADKNMKQSGAFDFLASDGPGVDLQPSEDGIARNERASDRTVDGIVDSRERKEV